MIDVNVFMNIMLSVLGSILLITLIILVVKLISTVDRFNKVLDDVNTKVAKFDNLFNLVDIITDNMAMISDKLVDSISNFIRKILTKKQNRKEDLNNEE